MVDYLARYAAGLDAEIRTSTRVAAVEQDQNGLFVVRSGNSAVQIAYELADVADVTIASRQPLAFLPQRREGRDMHYWLTSSGFDDLPPEWLIHSAWARLVMDLGDYRAATESGRLRRRPILPLWTASSFASNTLRGVSRDAAYVLGPLAAHVRKAPRLADP